MTTPPGWYPDPGSAYKPKSRAQERWWDGSAWSGQTRTRGAVRGPLVAGIVGGLVLVAALLVASVLVFGAGVGRSTGDEAGGPPPPEAPPRDDGPGGSGELPEEDGGEGEVPASGVDLPVLDGWQHDPLAPMVTTGEYTCPGDGGENCLRGSAVIVVAGTDTGSAEDAAKSDIGRFAKTAYSKGTYGGITSHKAVASEKTTVAGEEGYRVRWKIVNRTKPDAYVESLAFPHPSGSGEMLLLRSGFDIHRSAPPLKDMDKLAEGVRERPDAGTGGGPPGESV
ncbi:hypothetical protein GCM10012287_13110 [Streptomyces daqingensis]|uniref:DUF2510 domain-containing protein n=1 Tax=Streptomyces daqingensis TaxID=1472640 RepID=A0ABQ2M0G1_9ACTN|nr:DUF2510 domain-containing protein [Streptomyces daqingensis]GGO45367.1 hypothetical protein GCM10012287_13110 [Streptomyces daqingensis]